MDAAGKCDWRGVDSALYSGGDIGDGGMESSCFGSGGDRYAFYIERGGKCVVELCVLLSPQDGASNLGMSSFGSYDCVAYPFYRSANTHCGMVAGAIRGVGQLCVISKLSGVGDESVKELEPLNIKKSLKEF